MDIVQTAIPDVLLLQPKVFGDERGFFMETFRASSFADLGIEGPFVQDNHSASEKGVLRGLHYQIKQAQGKLVRVTSGEVYDVAVDMRRSSATYGQYVGEILSAENKRILWVPPGFAHGFLVLSEYAEFTYKCSDYYAPEHERSLRWDDETVGIEWPVMPGIEFKLSDKDRKGTSFHESESFP